MLEKGAFGPLFSWHTVHMARSYGLVVLALVMSPLAGAAGVPVISDIRFEGNHVTREEVLLRELNIRIGDLADPVKLTNGHQAILDLGLFREVEARYDYTPEGTVVVVRVREKRYFLPVPRLDGSSDGGSSYGAQLRWDNVGGRNHSLSAHWETGKPGDRIAEEQTQARFSYSAPYFWRDHYGIEMAAEHITRDALGPMGVFDEKLDAFEVRMWRDMRYGRPRSGWDLGAGFAWQQQRTAGALAPVELGQATSLVLTAYYSDLRFHLYSETGRVFSTRLSTARDGWLSDYSFTQVDLAHRAYIGLDGGPHRSLNITIAGGAATGGSDWRNTYGLGGSSRLRGYDLDWIEGNRYGYVAVEYLRPIAYNWLRFLAIAEAGVTGGSVNNARSGGAYASLGVGVRVRLPWFIGVEIEAGVAYPLRGGDGLSFFAGRNR